MEIVSPCEVAEGTEELVAVDDSEGFDESDRVLVGSMGVGIETSTRYGAKL